MSKVCCVVLNYNDADTTIKLINSIKDYGVFSSIIVVDNCSTDNSYEVLSSYSNNERLLVLTTNRNAGYGAGNNFGIKYAYNVLGADYVLICNPDVSFSESLVSKLKNQLESDGDAAVVTAIQFDIEHNPIKTVAWKIPSSLEYAVSTTKIKYLFHSDYSYDDLSKYEKQYVDCIPGALLMYDAKKFLEVGGYDENMFLYCEEVTIAIKLRKKGYKTIILGQDKYYHEHSVSINKSIESKTKQLEMIYNNRLYVMNNYLHSSSLCMRLAKFLQNRRLRKLRQLDA